jgi:hypothetical protein
MQTTIRIDFEILFRDITSLFVQNPSHFIANIRKSHHIPRQLPENFGSLDIQSKTKHFFAQFRFVFNFDELEVYAKQANMQPESFRRYFPPQTCPIFSSICWLYQTLLYSLKGTPVFTKNAPNLVFAFAKLLVPDGHRHLESVEFHLDYVYISPVFITYGQVSRKPGYCLINETGVISLVDAASSEFLLKIDQNKLSGVSEGDKLLFYDQELKPQIELVFPSMSSACDAFTFSLKPPRRGFMQLSAFLHSVAAFEDLSKFFPQILSASFPDHFTKGLRACLTAPSMELLLYIFSLPTSESKVAGDNIEFFLDLIGDRILPFVRALVQLKWESAPYGGQLIFRQNSQFTVLCRMLLRLFSGEYADLILKECRRLLSEHGGTIKAAPIQDDEDALAFLNNIFDPMVEFIFASVAKMPEICRALHRLLFVRTAGFYVDQAAPSLVIPNLLFLRFLIPPIAEETTITYAADPKMRRISSLLSGSLLSLCNRLGWPEDKEPYMVKYQDRIERFYPKIEEFTFQMISCHEWGQYDLRKLEPKGNPVELIGTAAKRVILLNMKEPNRLIHSHVYSVSIMHMIEEFVYDFGPNDAARANHPKPE